MRIVLVNPPVAQEALYGPVAWAAPVLPPLGLAALAAHAMRNGIHASVVDAVALRLDVEGTAAAVMERRPDAIGIGTTTVAFGRAAAVARACRRIAPGIPILVGGPHPTAVPEATLRDCPEIDAVVFGEGERTLVEACGRIEAGDRVAGVRGTAWRDDGGAIVVEEARPFLPDLDALPHPAWRLLPPLATAYRQSAFGFASLPSTYVVASRGCPSRCTFCAYEYWGRRYRQHGVAWTIDLLRDLHRWAGIRDVAFDDAIFGAKRSWMISFCEALLRADFRLTWSCNLRVDSHDAGVLALMREAGCWGVAFGIESGSERILETVNKRTTPGRVAGAVAAARGAGLVTKGYVMVGLPGETEETLAETSRFVLGLDLDLLTVNHFVPYPGTVDWDRADTFGRVEGGWDVYNWHHPSFVPHGFTRERLLLARRDLVRRFYLRPRVIARAASLARRTSALPLLARGALGLARLLAG
ncbi:MAG: cobalamin-dependent protein [Deltaproteobacteria bacterium]|nr:cobalamin-dependent protein [Deltaproteobacteria bacterium]